MNDIDIQIADRIATVTINRPAQRNAMSLGMWRGLAQDFNRLSSDADVRGIILTGAGQDFCAGADISEFGRVRADAEQAAAYEAAVDACADAVQTARQPTIAALHGYCLGGGCHLALACDFRVADSTARIGVPSARLSIVYGVASTQRLLATVGLASAKRILYAAERIGHEEAMRIGLVDRIGDSSLQVAHVLADEMVQSAPLSIAGAKFILDNLSMSPGTLDYEAAEQLIARAADSADYREGRDAFLAKRPPDFKGN